MAAKAKSAPVFVGGYEVVERVATTEMGAVFRGRHPTTGEVVAVKMASRAVVANPVLVRRFDQEYTVIRNFDHPHIVRAFRFGHEDGTPFMILEYVDGPTLGDRIEREGRLAEAEAVRIIGAVGDALHYAHQHHRVIHRDVKPDNILLTAEGAVKLADLGLAKDTESDAFLTRGGVGLGTPNFMAPEQFRDARNVDRRVDVYSLGATLYMAVTGELPFRTRGALGVLRKKLDNEIVPPRQLAPDLSPRVEAAILRAVHANPQARHATCQEFVKDLQGGAGPAAAAVPKAGGAERRATVRFPSQRGSSCQPLRGEKDHRWKATVRDFSADGVGLVLDRRFEPRTVLALELAATDKDPARRLMVRVVRATPQPFRRWLLGCTFAARLSEEEVQALL
jgi:serine/threonine protein kinase